MIVVIRGFLFHNITRNNWRLMLVVCPVTIRLTRSWTNRQKVADICHQVAPGGVSTEWGSLFSSLCFTISVIPVDRVDDVSQQMALWHGEVNLRPLKKVE